MLGCLIEKERTVPDTYPMTLNGLRTACNQSTSRDPITNLTDSEIVHAVEALKDDKLVRFVHASHGARTTKYRQVLDETLELEPAGDRAARAADAARRAVVWRAAHAQRSAARVRVADRRRGDAPVARGSATSRSSPASAASQASATTAGSTSSATGFPSPRSTPRPRGVPASIDDAAAFEPDPDLLERVAALEAKVADLERLLNDL